MKNTNQRLKETINSLITTNFDKVTSKIDNKKGVVLEMTESKKDRFGLKQMALALGVILVLLIGYLGINFYNINKIMSTVTIDVNPSIELAINSDEKILEVIAKNEEAKKVMGSMDLKGSTVEVAINAIVGSMLKNGYIDELKNSIILSVVGGNNVKNEELRTKLTNDIDTILKENNLNGSIISQTVRGNDEIKTIANDYNISVGKANLISKIIKQNSLYSYEELAKLSANELSLLISSKNNNVSEIVTTGTPSSESYVGYGVALNVALADMKIKKSNISNIENELDLENGIMVYDIEFDYNNQEYDYEIDALNGSIIKSNYEPIEDLDDDNSINKGNGNKGNENSAGNNIGTHISKLTAKSIALKESKVTAPIDLDIEFEYMGGTPVYEIDFETATNEYEYIINAETGVIITSKIEIKD